MKLCLIESSLLYGHAMYSGSGRTKKMLRKVSRKFSVVAKGRLEALEGRNWCCDGALLEREVVRIILRILREGSTARCHDAVHCA